MPKIELKPCPFCGNLAHIYHTVYPSGYTAYKVCCIHETDCYLNNGIPADFETEEEAAEAWNRRYDNAET